MSSSTMEETCSCCGEFVLGSLGRDSLACTEAELMSRGDVGGSIGSSVVPDCWLLPSFGSCFKFLLLPCLGIGEALLLVAFAWVAVASIFSPLFGSFFSGGGTECELFSSFDVGVVCRLVRRVTRGGSEGDFSGAIAADSGLSRFLLAGGIPVKYNEKTQSFLSGFAFEKIFYLSFDSIIRCFLLPLLLIHTAPPGHFHPTLICCDGQTKDQCIRFFIDHCACL